MTVAHEVKRIVIQIAPLNATDPQPGSFESQLQAALVAQNSGAHDDWAIAYITDEASAHDKILVLFFKYSSTLIYLKG
jgi:hypothetical protein